MTGGGLPVAGSGPIESTAHPMQRVGAWALITLAGVTDPTRAPESLTVEEFGVATTVMADDLLATAVFPNARGPGSFWLAASYLLWPNSALNEAARSRRTPAERRERIAAWRTYPTVAMHPEVPCWLCGRPAIGWFGKVDIPLGAAKGHLNTLPQGYEGQPLCAGCLASFHALPYGCMVWGGMAAMLHSWDDRFLQHAVARQVPLTRAQTTTVRPDGADQLAHARAVVRDYPQPPDVEVLRYSNSNRDQRLEIVQLAIDVIGRG